MTDHIRIPVIREFTTVTGAVVDWIRRQAGWPARPVRLELNPIADRCDLCREPIRREDTVVIDHELVAHGRCYLHRQGEAQP